ncbi:PH domain-containing protein [Sphingobacterium rhinopitheci]|uniref:PH domain-containing protein n=1 Tax=Sphingobacterium rhinopitheci TaxID=2781960 RepID=UPI001F51BB8D|nr:PH domain-containing protein [Sphingobacterium rhinopitheci]MCI0920582.1 PH domain-containing protein [Sphingobacterium rhinopitheci]
MQIFKAKRDYKTFLDICLYLSPAILIIFVVSYVRQQPMLEALYASLCTIGLCLGLISIFYFTTRYTVDDSYLHYRSGFIFGKVEIAKIHKIELYKTLYVGMRPATSKNGIIIYYNKYDEIYISPEDNEEFAAALSIINPSIEVINPKSKKG